jgi:hypothetical protein
MKHPRYPEAEAKFKEALAEARLGFPPSDLHIPSALNMLAEFYRNTKKFDQAAALYQEVRTGLTFASTKCPGVVTWPTPHTPLTHTHTPYPPHTHTAMQNAHHRPSTTCQIPPARGTGCLRPR